MNIMKWEIDTMMDTINLLSKRVGKPFTQTEREKIATCNEIYNKCIADHERTLAYRAKYKRDKRAEAREAKKESTS